MDDSVNFLTLGLGVLTLPALYVVVRLGVRDGMLDAVRLSVRDGMLDALSRRKQPPNEG